MITPPIPPPPTICHRRPRNCHRRPRNQIIEACQDIYEKSLIDGRPSKLGFVFPKVKCLKVSQGGVGHKLIGGG